MEQNYFLRKAPDRRKGKGRLIAGIVLGIFPGVWTALFLMVTIGFVSAGGDAAAIGLGAFGTLFMGAVTLAFAMLARSGKRQNDLVKRYYEYGNLVGSGKEYIAVAELAEKANVSKEQIRRDILAMRAEGYLPYAALDKAGTTVILTDGMYQQYLKAEQTRAKKEEEERIRNLREAASVQPGKQTWEEAAENVAAEEAKAEQRKSSAGSTEETAKQRVQSGPKPQEKSEVQILLEEGNSYIAQIREINDRIPDTEEMSDKLYRLEDIMKRIFAQAEKYPDNVHDLHKLLAYYLPTTMKLLRAYADLNEQPQTGENARDTKRQIEDSMDAINGAFEKLLDNLFQEEAWDLSSDLNVMKTMMAQDGLA